MDRVTSKLYIRGTDSQSGYRGLGPIFRGVFWAVVFVGFCFLRGLFLLGLGFCGVCGVFVEIWEVGLKSVICRRSTN